MIVFIPTYQRVYTLPYVIECVLNSKKNFDEKIKIIIHNNHYPDLSKIDQIIDNITDKKNIEFIVYHRKKNSHIHGWFEAIFENAKHKETIFFLGDDDLILPWGFDNRFKEINNHNADFLLNDFWSRIYFYEEGLYCWPNIDNFEKPKKIATSYPWEPSTEGHINTSALFNHVWRNTEKLKEGLDLAFSWINTQKNWSGIYNDGLIFAWLPYALKEVGGKVINLPEKSVLRGGIVDQLKYQDYADGGTTSFYSLLYYDIFSNISVFKDNKKFNELRKKHLKIFKNNIYENFNNPNITLFMINEGLKSANLSLYDCMSFGLLNIKKILKIFKFFRAFRLRAKIYKKKDLVLTKDFLKLLNNL